MILKHGTGQLNFTFRVKAQLLTEMCLAIIPSISYVPKARPKPDTNTPYVSGDWFRDLTGSGPQSGQAGAERTAEERHVINGSYLEVVMLGS